MERSTGGRPAIRLRLSDKNFYSIGADVHDWETRLAVCSPSGEVRDIDCIRTPEDPTRALAAIAERVEAHIKQEPEREIVGVGVSLSGLVDSRTGVVELGHDVRWTAIPVGPGLEERLGLRVSIENNVRAAAFAEYHYGSVDVRDAHCLLFVGVQEGIGVSILFDGETYLGQHMAAGEFGQMVIEYHDGPARHDRPGCLEQLAADPATCERYFARLGSGGKELTGDVGGRVRQICRLAAGGDAQAIAAVQETARYLGVGICNMVWGLDPDAIIVDGPIVEAWNLVGPAIQEQFPQGREFLSFRNLVMRPSALSGEASLVGAAVLPFREFFDAGKIPSVRKSAVKQVRSA